MKTIIKSVVAFVLLLAPASMSAQNTTDAEDARQMLSLYCQEKMKEVPIKDGESNSFYLGYFFEDNQMNIVYGVETELFNAMSKNREAAAQALVEELASNEELVGMLALLTICDGSLVYVAAGLDGDATDPNNQLMFPFDADNVKAIVLKAAGD